MIVQSISPLVHFTHKKLYQLQQNWPKIKRTNIRKHTGGDLVNVVHAFITQFNGQREGREVIVGQVRARRETVGPAAGLQSRQNGSARLVAQKMTQVAASNVYIDELGFFISLMLIIAKNNLYNDMKLC